MLNLEVSTLEDLQRLTAAIAVNLKPENIILLSGTLGSGKTTFTQFLIKHLNPSITEVPSPTFNIVLCYSATLGEIWHFDLYRVQTVEELEEIAFFDAIKTKLCIIEWPEIAEKYIISDNISIKIDLVKDSSKRIFSIVADNNCLARIKKSYDI